ncbi:MAG: STAS/SEC14 domain-containing protein [Cyanobacteria bacterium P01_A01_bin.83]
MTITLIPHKHDNIIGLDIDGWIDAEDIERIVQLIETKFKPGEKLRIYAEVNNWSGISLKALLADLRFSLQHFPDFEKEAIVSDRRWLESLAALGNTLFSGIEVKHFKLEEKEQALSWIMT